LARKHDYQSSKIIAAILQQNEAFFFQNYTTNTFSTTENPMNEQINTTTTRQSTPPSSSSLSTSLSSLPPHHPQPQSPHSPPPPIQFLILRCNIQDKCGGFADRIKPLPVLLAAAAKSHRIFGIRWQRPAPLQEFLVPTQYVNWTVPTWLEEAIQQQQLQKQQRKQKQKQYQRTIPFLDEHYNNHSQSLLLTVETFFGGTKLMRLIDPDHQQTVVLEGKIQDSNGGEKLYHELVIREGQKTRSELSLGINQPNGHVFFDFSTDPVARYQPIYHDLFHYVFRPSVPIANLVHHTLQSMNLTPGRYVSAHFRAGLEVKRGPKFKKDPTYLAQAAIRAVNCSSAMLLPGWPIYFATDSQVSLQAVRDYAQHYHRPIVTYEQQQQQQQSSSSKSALDNHEQLQQPQSSSSSSSLPLPNLHIEKTVDWDRRPPSDFYSTFVDFLVMASGRCMAYGGGGFGKFAGMIGYNSSCILDHSHMDSVVCEWVG
jgi:hypothetical protein